LKLEHYKKDEVIFRQGDPSACMYRIEKGKVGVVLDYESDAQTNLSELAAGQFLGEMGLIEQTARSATAVSLSDDTELQVIDEENVGRWFAENPEETRFLLKQMSMRLRRSSRDYAEVCRTVSDVVEAEKAGTRNDPALQNRIRKTLAGFEASRLEGTREGGEKE
jgi:CRP-like cAMP-binding protein